jgi:hypothetical protein
MVMPTGAGKLMRVGTGSPTIRRPLILVVVGHVQSSIRSIAWMAAATTASGVPSHLLLVAPYEMLEVRAFARSLLRLTPSFRYTRLRCTDAVLVVMNSD